MMDIKRIVATAGGPAKVGRACRVTPQAVSQWGEIVPLEAAIAIGVVTRGELVPNPRLYPMWARALKETKE